MSEILDRVADTYGMFRPANVEGIVALYLALKLDDVVNVRCYTPLVCRYPARAIRNALANVLRLKNIRGRRADLLQIQLEAFPEKELYGC